MSFIDIAKKRFSCRDYQKKEVDKDTLLKIMEAGRIAPSANNFQPWYFYVISEDKNLLQKMYDAYPRKWFNGTPVVIVACANYSQGWVRDTDGKNHAEIDVSIAIDHITLQAADLGLGTCWICHFDVDMVKKVLNLAENVEPVALISLGYCNKQADINRFETKRKKIDEITKFL